MPKVGRDIVWGTFCGNQLRQNMTSGVGLSVVAAAAMALSYRLYLQMLGYEAYGLWLVLATVIAFSQVGNLGISQAVAKRVAEQGLTGDLDVVASIYTTATLLVILTGSGFALITIYYGHAFVGSLHLSRVNSEVAYRVIPWIALLSIYIFVVDISNNVLNGLGRMDLCAACQVLAQCSALLVSVVLLNFRRNIDALLIGNASGYLAGHLLSLYLVNRLTHNRMFKPSRLRGEHVKALWSFGGWMFGSGVLGLCYAPVNRLALARFGDVALVPIFDIAYSVSTRVRSLLEPALRPLMAEASTLLAKGGHGNLARIRALHVRCLKLVSICSVPVTCLLVASPFLMRQWLGPKYRDGINVPFRIMLIAVFAGLLAAPAYYILIGRGHTRIVFTAVAIQAMVNVGGLAAILVVAHTISVLTTVISASAAMVISGAYLYCCEQRQEKLECYDVGL